ncbi:hypothetical protein SESBI_08383 [Sesbania bispinosa]|nr:hypothetical protein SESBI_08383 [Sesbania bispinosa]
MASGSPKHDKNLSTQLAVAVRSIQWSYGIFWALSTTQQRVLEWRDGYYNGDIKTRKTVQTMETKADKIGLQRSEQLKELYKFLLVGEADPQTKRPSAALSPEDLSDSEWYYLVCMSFVFYPNQSSLKTYSRTIIPSSKIQIKPKSLQYVKTANLTNLAEQAEETRKEKTVVCFPYLGGVIEIGTTELVSEDHNLIQHVKACFLEISKPICSDKSSPAHNKPHDDKYPACTKGDHGVFDTMALENSCSLVEEIKLDQFPVKELQDDDNNEHCDMDGCRMDESMLEGINGVSSQVHFVNDALINGAPDSLSSCDCMSEASENHGKDSSQVQQRELQDHNQSKHNSLDIGADEDLYYSRTLCTILGNSSAFRPHPNGGNSNFKSSFVKWKKGGISERKRPRFPQSMLKKTLFNVPFMHTSYSSLKSQKENEWTSKLENDDDFMPNIFDNERETRNFQVRRSVAPSSLSEVEKISILGDTIKYLKELESRVEELESYMDIADSEARTRRKCPDVLEQISDNYGARKIYMGMKPIRINKRKGCDIDEMDTELDRIVSEEAKKMDVKVNMKEQEFRGAATAPMGMIKEALWKVSGTA